MLRSFKMNTSMLICAAFIFRLLFVNIGIVASFTTQQQNHHHHRSAKTHFSSVAKRRKSFEPSSTAKTFGYPLAAVFKEDTDDEKQLKSNPLLFLHVLYSLVAGEIENRLERISPFHWHFSYASPHRYLVFQVFRI